MLTYANAPAVVGEGVGILLGSRNAETHAIDHAQKQLLSARFGLSAPLAGVVFDLLRGRPWHG